jgi:hypothetical protein
MATDSKSNVGRFDASPDNPRTGQHVIYEQRLKGQELKQGARDIDILAMDSFGSNVQVYRKDLSILDAVKTNTDKEYGIIQIEDDFEFVDDDYIVISDENATDTSAELKLMSLSGTVANDMASPNIFFKNGVVNYIFPHIFYGYNDSPSLSHFDNIQFIGSSTIASGDVKINNTNLTLGVSGTLNNSTAKLITNVQGGTLRGELKAFDVQIFNRESVLPITIKSTIIQDVSNSLEYRSVTCAAQQTITGTLYGGSGSCYDIYAIEIIFNGYSIFFHLELYEVDSAWEIYSPRWSLLTYGQQTRMGRYAGWISNGDVAYPQCEIVLSSRDQDGTIHESAYSLTKTANGLGSNYYVSKLPNLIYDFSYWGDRLVYMQKITLDTTIATSTITATPDIYLTKVESCDAFLLSQTAIQLASDIAKDKLIKYFKLVDISSDRSIGIAKRTSGRIVLCINNKTAFYTANGLTSEYPADIVFNGISIVSNTVGMFSFIFEYSVSVSGTFVNKKAYCTFRNIGDMSSGQLMEKAYRDAFIFDAIHIDNKTLSISDDLQLDHSIIGEPGSQHKLSITSLNNDVYFKYSVGKQIKLPEIANANKITISTGYGLGDMIISLTGLTEYMIHGLTFFFSISLQRQCTNVNSAIASFGNYRQGRTCLSIITLPSFDPLVKTLTTLPLRMVDEYPAVYYQAPIADKTFILGKTKFVAIEGSLYETGGFNLVGDPYKLYLSDTGRLYSQSGYFFLAKDNLTNVYSFTELGIQPLLTIEDEIICDPIKISIGIIAVGTSGIWLITDKLIKLWNSTLPISQASIKTQLDNSCVIAIDDGSTLFYYLSTATHDLIVSSTGDFIGRESPMFTAITINQFGHISNQQITSVMETGSFIDLGSNSRLLVLDTLSTGVNYLEKNAVEETDYFELKSSQYVEMYGETYIAMIRYIDVYYQGIGNITFTINGSVKTPVAVSNSTGRYIKYRYVLTSSIPLSMFNYVIRCSGTVKIIGRIIARVDLMENSHG